MKNQPLITNTTKKINRMVYCSALITIFALFLSCNKKEEPLQELTDEYTYEVQCNYCEISYTDELNTIKTVKNNQGKWSYQLDQKITFELKLSIKTTLSTHQTIHAYILKNNEVVFGDSGYNYANITYDTKNATGIANYGWHESSGTGNGGSTGGNSKPITSVCGAINKTGGYCKRVVSGGGRCWQHR